MNQQRFAKSLRQNMTDAEILLWRHLCAHRLGGQKFRRQQALGTYIVDFVHFGARVIVEADGGQHNESEKDKVRDAWLRGEGFKVLRFWNDQTLQSFWNDQTLQSTDSVLEVIWAAVAGHVPAPPLPQPLSREGRGE